MSHAQALKSKAIVSDGDGAFEIATTDVGQPLHSRFFSPYLWILRHGNEDELGWLLDYVSGDRIDRVSLCRSHRALPHSSQEWNFRGPHQSRVHIFVFCPVLGGGAP